MKKFIVSCAALLLTVVCMASSISCSGGNSAQRDGKSYKMENTGLTINPVIPTSKDGKEQWKYIKANPGSGWNAKEFDDSSWKSGYGAFGTRSEDNTSWTTTDIWLRKEFTLEGCTQQQIDSLVLYVSHDEDCEIYINGILASDLDGYKDYYYVSISDEAKASIVVGEKNILAVHCYNGGGAGGIDVGVYKYSIGTMVTFFSTADVEPTTWKYVTDAPASEEWMNPTFDDAAWGEGLSSFGKNRSAYGVNTTWATNDIWLRKKVDLKDFSKADIKNLDFYFICDGEGQVYFNGIQVLSVAGTGVKKETATITDEVAEAIALNGELTIAVHCYRKSSQKIVDASLTCYMDGKYTPIKWEMKKGSLESIFAKDIDVNNVWGEYPRPQMVRKEWQSLNGVWELQPMFAEKEGMPENSYSMEILVPFPIESPISGIMKHYSRFAYRRTFTVPKEWKERNLLLHFEAVDWECEVFVNGQSVGSHKGGYEPFAFDVTKYLTDGEEQELVVKVYDPTDLGGQPRGKQTLSPGGIMYTSTSGIWQSVWMEPVKNNYIEKYTVVPNIDNSTVAVNVITAGGQAGKAVIKVKDGDNVVATAEANANEKVTISVPDAKLWSPDSPFLYNLEIALVDGGETVDAVEGYFGMRKISLGKDGGYTRMFLNNEPLFHIGPLDQGFWPDGIYTAPTDAAMLYDIQVTKQMGFNMIRKHIKIEPRRWYYHCDRLGMLVWQDMPSGASYGGVGIDEPQFKKELTAMIENLYNAPSIIMWIIFNESQGRHNVDELVKHVRGLDASRLVNLDSQYGTHSTYIGDVWDVHHYPNPAFVSCPNKSIANVCGEYGGLKYKEEGHIWGAGDWGYATMNSRKELMDTYEQYVYDLVKFRDCFGLGGAVYTQTTDVEIEINGLITYDRAIVKVDVDKMAKINNRVTKSLLKKDTIIATALEGGEKWKMTTTKPADDWYKAAFDDSSWKERKSGFGTSGTPNAVIGTTWNTSDIWIRKTFRLDGMTRQMADSLVMLMTHDEDCEIYINDKLMASYTGHDNNYSFVEFTKEVKDALVYDADNTIAVHCHQTYGGQFIDVGIYLLSQGGLTTSVTGVAADGTPTVAVDKANKTVAIVGGGFGENTRLDVINTAGGVVKSVVAGNEKVALSSLADGIYVLRFADGDKKYTCKVIF
ncbi:MAG: T9SS type A sorting domain-containing protein [Bacteroidales bacterium]|nr:T9SS type A sorting domain-containing protein [Bacteroidales bacterium]